MREAKAYVETQVALQLGKGYVEQIVAAEPDVPVERTARLETPVEHADGTRTREVEIVVQRDLEVAITRGTRARGKDALAAEEIPTKFERRRDASAYFDRYVEERIYDGAELVERPAGLASAPQSHTALEAACRAAPDDPMPWAVYADWLITQGDVLGEIASLAARGHQAGAQQMLGSAFAELYEDLGTEATPQLGFRHGFVVEITFPRDQDCARRLEAITGEVLRAPFTRFVESLRFGLASFDGDNAWTETMRAICEAPCAPFVRALRFDNYTYEDQELSWVGFGDFSFAWPQFPALELLHIRAGKGGELGTLHLPELKTFIRESGGLGDGELAAITTAHWPALEHLELWFGSHQYGATGTLATLTAILANELPNLAHLGVVNCEFVDDVIPALAAWPGLARLCSLDLSKGVLHDRGAALLVEHAPAFRHLASIDLSENLLGEPHVSAIRGVLDNVITNDQREYQMFDDEDEDDNPRYVAVGE